MTLTSKWSSDLAAWGIPSEILNQAPQSPWIHPPALFTVPDVIPDTPSHRQARELLRAGDSVLDVGCGGGIAAFATAPPAGTVIGVDHQQQMLDMFAATATSRDLQHHEILGDWPDVADQTPIADVVTCHHVVFNVPHIENFIHELDRHARKRVVIEMPQLHPLTTMSAAWKYFWKLERPTKPTSQDLIDILKSMNLNPQFEHWSHPIRSGLSMDDEVRFMRIRLCLPESRDEEIREFIQTNPAASERKLTTIWWDK